MNNIGGNKDVFESDIGSNSNHGIRNNPLKIKAVSKPLECIIPKPQSNIIDPLQHQSLHASNNLPYVDSMILNIEHRNA